MFFFESCMKSFFVFDIETIPDIETIKTIYDISDPDPISLSKKALQAVSEEAKKEIEFFPPYLHKVICYSASKITENGDIHFIAKTTSPEMSEEQLIHHFWNSAQGNYFVSYNGSGFDLPVLELRALKYGLSNPFYYLGKNKFENYRYKYSDLHTDLVDFLSNFGATKKAKLDHIAALVGLPGKDMVSGKDVEALYYQNELEIIKQYCITDVMQTTLLFYRVQLLRGFIDHNMYAQYLEKFKIWFKKSLENKADAQIISSMLEKCSAFLSQSFIS